MRTRTTRVVDLKTGIRNQIWASGEPENLVSAHDDAFQEAFAEIAQWVICERDDNVNIVRFDQTTYKGGMTILPAPRGIVTRVFTVANEDYTDPVFLRGRPWPEPESWARNFFLSPAPDLTRVGKLPLGFSYADPNNDSLYGRSRTGVWSFYQGNIYIAPWIQSNELVVIEWKGIKTQWGENDLINPAVNYRTAVKLFMQYAHERDYGTMNDAMAFHNPVSHTGLFDEALATLILHCKQLTIERDAYPQKHERNRICSEIADDAPMSGVTDLVLAHIGNGATIGEDLDDVGTLMRNWGPNAILGVGFISAAQTDYDASAGDQFNEYLSPYAGNKGPGAKSNALWTAPAAEDWILDGLVSYRKFFNPGGNGRYYNVVMGDVHVFFIDTSASEPDGITAGGTQGAWLQAQLALSTSPWKIVVMDACPYGSVHSNVTLQWPFASWGAHLVVCSQAINYERLSISGLPIVNNGLGGLLPIEEVANPISTSVASYSAGPGALRIASKDTDLIAEFWSKDGVLVDTLELTK